MPSSTWTCPPGVTSVEVECWGGGSNGDVPGLGSGDGGGGGGYSRALVTVIPGHVYNVTWGGGNNDNTQTTFDVSVAALPTVASIPAADNVSGGVGDVKFNGGNGTAGKFTDGNTAWPAGGGGAGAGRPGAGGNSGAPAGGVAAAGSGAAGNGGDGGTAGPTGVNPSCGTNGHDGFAPGGGGGGVGWQVFCGSATAAKGAPGAIWIWNMTGHPGSDFPNPVALNPANIIGSFGSPPTPPPPPVVPKAAKRAFIM